MKKQLKEICNGFTKNIAQKELDELNGDYEIYGASGLIKKINYYISEVPYIGIVKDGSGVGRVNSYPAKSSLIGTMQYIVPNDGIDLQYLMYALRSMNLGKLFKGAAIPHIYFKEYKEFNVNVPSLPEQQKIARHLDTIQSAIDNKKQQLEQLDELVKSKFVEMFGENPVESGKWKIEKLGDLVTVTSSKRIYANEQCDRGIPFLRISDLVLKIEGIENSELFISREKYNEFKRKGFVPSENDILVTTRGTLGLCYVVSATDEFYFQDGMITWLKFDQHNQLQSNYLCFVFKSFFKQNIENQANGATVKYVSISDLKEFLIPVPPFELQNAFAAFVQKIDMAKSLVKKQVADLSELLDSKMDEYFGE